MHKGEKQRPSTVGVEVGTEHSKDAAGVATGAFDEAIRMGLVRDAEVVLNACDSDEFFCSGLDKILGVVGAH